MPGFDYRGSLVAHVTIVTRLRQHIFTDDNLAQKCLDALNESAQRFDATLHAYCLMPDHLHLLVYVDAEATLKQFVHHFKTISSFRIKQETGQSPWQTSYHEHPASRRQHQRSPGLYLEQPGGGRPGGNVGCLSLLRPAGRRLITLWTRGFASLVQA
jgi:REP element-mobilizing transposase RayT